MAETVGMTEPALWPKPDDPAWAGADEAGRRWLENTQPEAIYENVTGHLEAAYWALSGLLTYTGGFPQDALQNALNELPADQSTLLQQALDLMRKQREDQEVARSGGEPTLRDQIHTILMSKPVTPSN